jgi:chromosome segregation protein
MILKKIELIGFKSFFEKTSLDIYPGITAIAGPNGCGKSNIVDAIKWVLGEQSPKEMRASGMQDVIFNGTTEVKPLGMAEVSLVIEDSEKKLPIDYAEVRITRRLFRTGESQYLINKNPCRLKDIQELFMDTGIGNDSYAIMAQGKIDELLTSKPEDRRAFFEEAAGITKYKTRRNEAMRKLEKTEENLTRLNDILREIEKNISSLKIKAGKAKKYKEYYDRLKEMETQYTSLKITSLQKEAEALLSNKKAVDELIFAVREAIALQEKQLSEIRESLEKSDDIYRSGYEHLNQLQNQIERNIQQKTVDGSRIQDIAEKTESLQSETTRLQEKCAEIKAGLEGMALEVDEITRVLQEKNSLIEQKEQESETIKKEISSIQKDIEQKTNDVFQCAQDESRAKNELIEISANLKSMGIQKEKIQSENSSLIRSLSEIDSTLKDKDVQITSLRSLLDSEKSGREEILKRISGSRSDLETDEKKLFDLRSSISEKTSRMNALTAMERNYEGFLLGIKKIMEQKNIPESPLKGIEGTVSDIISVDKEYADAIEAALGSRIQHIVVENADGAGKSIEFLKTNQLGIATFLPLDIIQARERCPFEKQEGIIGHILDFVHFDEKHRNVLNYLLGRYILVSSIREAVSFSRTWKGDYHFITPDGDHASVSGSMTGGYLKSSIKGIISRKSDINELKKTVDSETDELNRYHSEAERKKKQLEELYRTLQQCEERITQQQISCHEKESVAREERQKMETVRRNIETTSAELHMMDSHAGELKGREENLNGVLSRLQQRSAALSEELREARSRIEQKVKSIELLRDSISEIRVEKAAVNERLQSIAKRKSDLEFTLQEASGEAVRKQAEAAHIEKTRQELEKHIAELDREILKQQAQELGIKDQITTIEKDRVRLRREEELMTQGIHNNNVSLQVEQEKLSALSISFTEAEGKISHLKESYRTKYEEDLPELPEGTLPEGADTGIMEKEMEELRSKLKYVGPVNLESIKEYDELQERYSFLQTQQNDLNNAKITLIQIINKLNVQAKEQFAENFEKIRNNFKEMFAYLFKGGTADIFLVDENDILESGIEITAKPPGKKNQTIMLLSGGERALSSIALVFSIFKLKPSFFCILDELDAPLDETNIVRFTGLLKSFADQTQFLIITHSKTTLKIADYIYGITMSKPGISTTVSVNLKESKKAPVSEALWEKENGPETQAVSRSEETPRRQEDFSLQDRISQAPPVEEDAPQREGNISLSPE